MEPAQPPPIPEPPGSWRGLASRPPAPVPWGTGEATFVGILAVVFGSILGVLLVVVTAMTNTCGPQTVLGLVGTEIGLVSTVVFWITKMKRAPLSTLGLPRRPLADIGTGVAGGAVLYAIAVVVSLVVVAIVTLVIGHRPTVPQQVGDCVRGPWLVLTAVTVVVLPPIGEETLFRGFIFQGLRGRLSFWPAVVADGLLFGAIHIPFWLLIPSLTAVGMGLACIYAARRSVLASMAAHATFNLIGIATIALSRH
jgi:CAAX protease family protein